MPERNWHVIFTFTGQEEKLTKFIEQRLKGINYELLIPRRERYERKNGKMEVVAKTLFPGYVFIKLIMTHKIFYTIRNIPRPTKILGISEDGIKIISDEEMKPILDLTDDQGVIRILKGIAVGSKVQIIDGAFKGYHGIVKEINKRQKAVKIELCMFNTCYKFILGIDIVKPVEEDKARIG